MNRKLYDRLFKEQIHPVFLVLLSVILIFIAFIAVNHYKQQIISQYEDIDKVTYSPPTPSQTKGVATRTNSENNTNNQPEASTQAQTSPQGSESENTREDSGTPPIASPQNSQQATPPSTTTNTPKQNPQPAPPPPSPQPIICVLDICI